MTYSPLYLFTAGVKDGLNNQIARDSHHNTFQDITEHVFLLTLVKKQLVLYQITYKSLFLNQILNQFGCQGNPKKTDCCFHDKAKHCTTSSSKE